MYKNKLATLFGKVAIIAFIYLYSSCSAPKTLDTNFLYFQKGLDSLGSTRLRERVIQASDLLSILIYTKSLNQDQVTLFNIPNAANSGLNPGYIVSTDGDIEMPVIGKVHVAGLTKPQLQTSLVEKLAPYVKDPSVNIRFLRFRVNVLGEVKIPGAHSFEADHVTILDAISIAGDLTDYGKRKDVMVIRDDSTVRQYYRVDLTSGDLFKSPAYQLHPNDVVYVGATNKKLEIIDKPLPNDRGGWQLALSIITAAVSVVFVTYNISK